MAKLQISKKFRLDIIDQTRNYFIEERKRNDLISEKHKKVCTALNYIKK